MRIGEKITAKNYHKLLGKDVFMSLESNSDLESTNFTLVRLLRKDGTWEYIGSDGKWRVSDLWGKNQKGTFELIFEHLGSIEIRLMEAI